jgi:acetyl coenzyme A synthetase (ADP forming)-like protein
MMPDIKYLFEPRSVAVIGATDNPLKLGHVVLNNVVSGGFEGRVYPVNPKGGQIMGLPAIKSLGDVEGGVDLAVVVIPADRVFDAIKDCADHNVRFAAIITSGFSEIGNTAEERRIVSYAVEHGMRILGPNIVGIFSSVGKLNATFAGAGMGGGTVALISQSGALAGAIVGKALVEHIGFSTVVSIGNKADISETDLLDYIVSNETTKVIMMYMEGVTHGEQLVNSLQRVTRIKPVIVLKSGRSKRGALAAASHTGSLAGEDRVFDDIARQSGLIRAEGVQEALEWCKFVASIPEPKGENTIIITNGGGMGVMAADACEKYGINLYDNLSDMKTTFTGIVPEFGSSKNPIDITGQATAADYTHSLDAALANDNINSILCLGCGTGLFDIDQFASQVAQEFAAGKYRKPLLMSFVGGLQVENNVKKLNDMGIPIFGDILNATSCLGAVYSNYRHKLADLDPPEEPALDEGVIRTVIDAVRKDNRRFLLANEGQAVLKAIGVRGPQSIISHSIDEAITLAEKIGYPVVMKVVSRDIIHKSDAGGVALDILNRAEVSDAYEAILQSCRRFMPDARIEGIEISEQVKPGVETIVGGRRDISFGPIVMFGLGGIYVEVMKDIVFRAFPLSRKQTFKMISEIRTYPLLLGVRGEKGKDIDAVADVILRVGVLIKRFEDISDIEINPLVAYDHGEGVKAVDVRILLSKQEAGQ